MRNDFFEYLGFSDEEKKEIWERGIFVFDTNVLLNIYRYSGETREVLLSALESLEDKIWLPHQVTKEFMNRRCETIFETDNRYQALQKEGDKFVSEVRERLRLKIDSDELNCLQNSITSWIDERKNNDLLVSSPTDDQILKKLLDLFDSKIGEPFDEKSLNKIYEEGKLRYFGKVPPGYKDDVKNNKKANSGYGDLILWKQMIEYTSKEKKPLIFVTHDQKEDWWYIVNNKTIGPRPELIREFYDVTGHKVIMYSMNSFLEQIKVMGNTSISDNVLDEVDSISAVKHVAIQVPTASMLITDSDGDERQNIIKNIARAESKNSRRRRVFEKNEQLYQEKKDIKYIIENGKIAERMKIYQKQINGLYRRLNELEELK